MNSTENNVETMAGDTADALLRQLMYLKRYERPEPARMTRNKQNIMRQVRESQRSKRKTLGDLIEINIPWFFAEPKYGIAALFVAFAGLQYLSINANHAAQSQTGIYTTTGDIAAVGRSGFATEAATNSVSYPKLPGNVPLFQDEGEGVNDVKFVGRLERQ